MQHYIKWEAQNQNHFSVVVFLSWLMDWKDTGDAQGK